jgi:hypothetical protein
VEVDLEILLAQLLAVTHYRSSKASGDYGKPLNSMRQRIPKPKLNAHSRLAARAVLHLTKNL